MGSGCVSGANESTQVRLRVNKVTGCHLEQTKFEVSLQADEARSRARVHLNLAFSHFRALKESLGMKSDVELACFLLPDTDR